MYFIVYNRAWQKGSTWFLMGATWFLPAGCPMGNPIFFGVVKACMLGNAGNCYPSCESDIRLFGPISASTPIQHIKAETKLPPFCRRHSQMHYIYISISLKISAKFAPYVRINIIPALAHIMACRLVGTKPLSGPMMIRLLTHLCVTRPQCVKATHWQDNANSCVCHAALLTCLVQRKELNKCTLSCGMNWLCKESYFWV